jgi:hypothetical protein
MAHNFITIRDCFSLLDNCKHHKEILTRLSMTCKRLKIIYSKIIQNMIIRNECHDCYFQKPLCGYCVKYGTNDCLACTCIGCGRSANITGYFPIFAGMCYFCNYYGPIIHSIDYKHIISAYTGIPKLNGESSNIHSSGLFIIAGKIFPLMMNQEKNVGIITYDKFIKKSREKENINQILIQQPPKIIHQQKYYKKQTPTRNIEKRPITRKCHNSRQLYR